MCIMDNVGVWRVTHWNARAGRMHERGMTKAWQVP